MKKVIAVLVSIFAIALSESAIAQYNSPHKYTDAFGKIKIYIPGTADTVVNVLTETSKEYTFVSTLCGWISLRQSDTRKIKSFSTSILSSVVNFSFINNESSLSPICTWTGSAWSQWDGAPYAVGQNRPLGHIWRVALGNQFYVKVRNANYNEGSMTSLKGIVTYENTIKNKINSCGFGTITVSATRPMTTFKIANVNYTLANLPSVTKPIVCRIQNNSKIRYVPLN